MTVRLVEEQTPPVATSKKTHTRQHDDGSRILPCMEYFVALARRSKRPDLVHALVERVGETSLPDMGILARTASGLLSVSGRKRFFQSVAHLDIATHHRIEQAAERIVLMDDVHGAQAVQSLLNHQNPEDAVILESSIDRCSRALYLYLLQNNPESGVGQEPRFNQAERLQLLYRQEKSEVYSSHYLGPKGVEPNYDTLINEQSRYRIAALFKGIAPDQILIERFTRRDPGGKNPNGQGHLHVLTAIFNGTTAHFSQVADGEVVEHDEPAAMSVSFSWEPATGALGVFCEEKNLRMALATLFRDIVLACDGEIGNMPMRQFDIEPFLIPSILDSLKSKKIDDIEQISIQFLKIAQVEEWNTLNSTGHDKRKPLVSPLTKVDP